MDLSMWSALEAVLDQLEANKAVRGLVIISGLQRDVFSAGNDLKELYAPLTTFENYQKFWLTSNRFLVKLHRSRLATVAAIRGASPAGGCIISMCCDHRLMTTNGSIGLNEVVLGIPVPKYWAILMARLIGQKAAEKVLFTGKLMSPQEAKLVGLIDELVEDRELLLPAAEKLMSRLLKLPSNSYAVTKNSMRSEFCIKWEGYYAVEPESAWGYLNEPATLKVLAGAMASLSGKPKSKL